MATRVVGREQVGALINQWLEESSPASAYEVLILPGEVVIREPGSRAAEMDQQIDAYFERWDGLMKRLADA